MFDLEFGNDFLAVIALGLFEAAFSTSGTGPDFLGAFFPWVGLGGPIEISAVAFPPPVAPVTFRLLLVMNPDEDDVDEDTVLLARSEASSSSRELKGEEIRLKMERTQNNIGLGHSLTSIDPEFNHK
jgi:hypothetical protein